MGEVAGGARFGLQREIDPVTRPIGPGAHPARIEAAAISLSSAQHPAEMTVFCHSRRWTFALGSESGTTQHCDHAGDVPSLRRIAAVRLPGSYRRPRHGWKDLRRNDASGERHIAPQGARFAGWCCSHRRSSQVRFSRSQEGKGQEKALPEVISGLQWQEEMLQGFELCRWIMWLSRWHDPFWWQMHQSRPAGMRHQQ